MPLSATSSRFTGNSVFSASGTGYFALGGAIENNAGPDGYTAGQAVPSTATLTDCTFQNNLAQAGHRNDSNGARSCAKVWGRA